jgi:hypothetical protein
MRRRHIINMYSVLRLQSRNNRGKLCIRQDVKWLDKIKKTKLGVETQECNIIVSTRCEGKLDIPCTVTCTGK